MIQTMIWVILPNMGGKGSKIKGRKLNFEELNQHTGGDLYVGENQGTKEVQQQQDQGTEEVQQQQTEEIAQDNDT